MLYSCAFVFADEALGCECYAKQYGSNESKNWVGSILEEAVDRRQEITTEIYFNLATVACSFLAYSFKEANCSCNASKSSVDVIAANAILNSAEDFEALQNQFASLKEQAGKLQATVARLN